MLARFWPLIRKQRWLILASSLTLMSEVAFRVLEPWPLKFVIDDVIMPPSGTSASGASGGLDPMTILALSAAAVVLIAGLRAVCTYLRRVGFALAGSRVLTECRGELFSHLQRLSLSYHSKKRSGDLVTRIIGDIGQLKEVAITAAMPWVAHVFTLVAMLAVMVSMNWRLSLIGLAIVPLFLISTKRLGGRIRKIARVQRQRKGEMGATAAEVIGSIKTVQALSLEEIHQKAFAARNKSDLREGVKAKRLSARLVGTTDILIAIAYAAVLFLGARIVMDGLLTAGELLVFLAYLKTAFRPMKNMAKYSGRIAKAAASAERILEVLDTTPLIRNRAGAVPAPESVTQVRFEEVTFGYEPGRIAVENFNLEAQRGQVIVLAGPSGAGKSTVVNLMLRLYDPLAGRILLNGRDIRDYTFETVRRRVAVVPQENILFGVSVRDNIAYGSPGASDEQIIAAAEMARAHEFIAAMPQGYDTPVGERGKTLSEGQRQRIAIARAAIRVAPILVLDEPTASLDNQNNRSIREALRSLSSDRISFIIAHDLSTVHEDSIVIYLDHGRIVEQGTHAELLRGGGPYAAMYAIQSERIGRQSVGTTHAVPS
ncbi:MAG: ABC transporter ATP-binding protein [Planctomycetota bacterium]|jgi:ATP-binding cassette subfamily B protein